MIKSYCKINLSLRVLKKLKNGLHDIQSNTLLIDLHDIIKIHKINKKNDIIIFTGEFRKLVNKLKNDYPQLADPETNIVVAVNSEYSEYNLKLNETDEICLIPPVSGG